MTYGELEQAVEDLSDRADDQDDSIQNLSTDVDSNLQDLQSTVDDHSTQIEELNQNSGQLTFPLTQDTQDLINELFPRGSFTLVGGVYTILDGRISTTSTFLYSMIAANYGAGTLFYNVTKSAGKIVFQSSLGSDVSTFDYLLLP